MCGELHALRLLKCKGVHKCLGMEGDRQTGSWQYNLTWTMLQSHSGAELFSPGAMAKALLRVTSENSSGLHLGSLQSIAVLSQLG